MIQTHNPLVFGWNWTRNASRMFSQGRRSYWFHNFVLWDLKILRFKKIIQKCPRILFIKIILKISSQLKSFFIKSLTVRFNRNWARLEAMENASTICPIQFYFSSFVWPERRHTPARRLFDIVNFAFLKVSR